MTGAYPLGGGGQGGHGPLTSISKPKKVQVSKLNKFYSDKKNSAIIKNTLCEQQK